MAYYDIADASGIDFVCLVRDHAKRSTVAMLVRAADQRQARAAFKGERSFSLISVRTK